MVEDGSRLCVALAVSWVREGLLLKTELSAVLDWPRRACESLSCVLVLRAEDAASACVEGDVPALDTLLRLILNVAGGSPDEVDEPRVESLSASLCALSSVVACGVRETSGDVRGIGARSETCAALCPKNSWRGLAASSSMPSREGMARVTAKREEEATSGDIAKRG